MKARHFNHTLGVDLGGGKGKKTALATLRADEQGATIVEIAPRAGVSAEAVTRVLAALPAALRTRVKTLKLPEMPESATLVRTLLSQGKSVRYLVPEAVWEYIFAQKLYGFEEIAV